MPDPLFEIGEEVIYHSPGCKYHLTEGRIVERRWDWMFNTVTKESLAGWFYKLDTLVHAGGMEAEHELRKKHKPADYSFEELMNLDMPILEEA